MKTQQTSMMVAAAAAALLGSMAFGQAIEGVTVQGTRVISQTTKSVGPFGVPLIDVSLSYGVSTVGLDLATHVGALELEKRVHDAAVAACREIGRQYPDATPDEQTCARSAADKAMTRVHELEDAAAKKAAK
jgi:hypothetical protein